MAKAYDPIAPVAEEISEEACLLCFDEFQVGYLWEEPQMDVCSQPRSCAARSRISQTP